MALRECVPTTIPTRPQTTPIQYPCSPRVWPSLFSRRRYIPNDGPLNDDVERTKNALANTTLTDMHNAAAESEQ